MKKYCKQRWTCKSRSWPWAESRISSARAKLWKKQPWFALPFGEDCLVTLDLNNSWKKSSSMSLNDHCDFMNLNSNYHSPFLSINLSDCFSKIVCLLVWRIINTSFSFLKKNDSQKGIYWWCPNDHQLVKSNQKQWPNDFIPYDSSFYLTEYTPFENNC